MDAVFYLLDALRLFLSKSTEEIREIAFEIGLLGQYGLDINDPGSLMSCVWSAGENLLCSGASAASRWSWWRTSGTMRSSCPGTADALRC